MYVEDYSSTKRAPVVTVCEAFDNLPNSPLSIMVPKGLLYLYLYKTDTSLYRLKVVLSTRNCRINTYNKFTMFYIYLMAFMLMLAFNACYFFNL